MLFQPAWNHPGQVGSTGRCRSNGTAVSHQKRCQRTRCSEYQNWRIRWDGIKRIQHHNFQKIPYRPEKERKWKEDAEIPDSDIWNINEEWATEIRYINMENNRRRKQDLFEITEDHKHYHSN